ncbi:MULTISPECIES: Ger(x)C family spore germination protein [Bacillus]|uniref:Ger(x)C family spore germination protein n=1 Tax=Bacillus TaxID=1386 RepID=UPI00073C7415|nr:MULTISPECIES: Ger(x)C family spore germination protein [Bacillus]APH34427.1 spore gernimation protein KC [Bacillus subtilis]ATL38340.1 Ger(x)C family spore germination protein [Bacillus velezensis]KAF6544904.1 Ger(x)C family spore germination protein [Bacillus sp. EKM206B]KAF6545057.1 Ger(x)C family spore germination protein [Bacillus sp. EKM207B]KAF6554143.1 Ger(x)C family spore germination protein [Bacillus sp. EKM203B]
MKRRKWMLILCTMVSLMFVSGCWDKRELTDLAVISAIGIDRTETGKYVLHLQIINPGNVAGGLQGGGAGDRPPVSVYSVSGDNMTEALRKGSMKVSRRLYFAHTNLVVFSEKLAKEEGLSFILDNLDRDTEFRTTATVVIAHNCKAEDIIKVLTPIDKIPSNKVNKTLSFTQEQYGRVIKTNLQDVLIDLASPTGSPFIPGYEMHGDDKAGPTMENTQTTEPKAVLSADGLAVFKKDGRLDYWIEDDDSVGAVWLLNRIKHTFINADWKNVKHAISLQVTRQNTKVTATFPNGKPHIHVHAQVEGLVDAVRYPFHLSDPQVLMTMQKALSVQLEKDITKSIEDIKAHKNDFVGFGDLIYRKHPDKWKKFKGKWDEEYFPNLPVDVKTEVIIRRTGLRNNPLSDKLEHD